LEQHAKGGCVHDQYHEHGAFGQDSGRGRDEGLQLFNFTGTSQATPRTGLLTTASITGVRWDNSNHLYAISNASGKLFVFTVTSAGVTQAPGSPYGIPKPKGLIVQPK
jgi:hypothetical protein